MLVNIHNFHIGDKVRVLVMGEKMVYGYIGYIGNTFIIIVPDNGYEEVIRQSDISQMELITDGSTM